MKKILVLIGFLLIPLAVYAAGMCVGDYSIEGGDLNINDDTPHLTFRDTDSDDAYMWHVDFGDSTWGYLQLWRGTDTGNDFNVNPNTPLLYFDSNNDAYFYDNIKATSFQIGANTLTTSEWAFLDGQNQSVFTTSSPTFAGLNLGTGGLNTVGTITPATDSTYNLGTSAPLYFANAYIDRIYLNSTAYLDGAGAGVIDLNGNITLDSGATVSAPAFFLGTAAQGYMRFIATGGVNYIQSVDSVTTASQNMQIGGYGGGAITTLTLNATTTSVSGDIGMTTGKAIIWATTYGWLKTGLTGSLYIDYGGVLYGRDIDNSNTVIWQIGSNDGRAHWGVGTAAAPSISFLSYTSSGLYAGATPYVGMSIGGTETMRWVGVNVAMIAASRLYLDGLAATGDTYILESSANVMDFYAGGVNTLKLNATTAAITGNETLNGKITNYNGVATEGYGVPAIVDKVESAITADAIGSTNFTNAGTAGEYRISYYLATRTAPASGGNAQLTIAWTDNALAHTYVSTQIILANEEYTTGVIYVRLGSGSVSYSTTYDGGYNNLGRYDLYIACERVN